MKSLYVVLSCCLILTGCSTVQSDSELAEGSFEVIATAGFMHDISYAERNSTSLQLTVFIEGDGSPWIDGKHIARDPRPANPVALNLHNRHPGNSLIISRPCYGLKEDPACHFRYWTSHRYSKEVVDSLVAALKDFLSKHKQINNLVLFGHSGGGTLATLMACQFSLPVTVISLSANLDIDEWSSHHGWSILDGSLNPAVDAVHCDTAQYFHFVGSEDSVVPVHLNQKYHDQFASRPLIIEGANHSNWGKYFDLVLNSLMEKGVFKQY